MPLPKRRVNGRVILIAPQQKDLQRIDEIVKLIRSLEPKQPKASCPANVAAIARQEYEVAIAQYRLKLSHLLMMPRPTRTSVAQYLVRLGAKEFRLLDIEQL